MTKHSRRPSPALAVSLVALFVALGGTSYAALTVTGKTIKNGTVTGKDVKNRSLGAKELSKSAVSSLRGKAGPQGVPGTQGTPGTPGQPGAAGATKVVVRTVKQEDVLDGKSSLIDATCIAGERATGGGYRTLASKNFNPFSNRPNNTTNGGTPTGWHVEAQNNTGAEADMEAFVICASP